METQEMGQGRGADVKKAYQAPRLKMYGSLTELTNATMSGGFSDAGGKGMSGS
jgi:hypothetical protein